MTGYLLDTNVALIATQSGKLSRQVCRAIEKGPLFLSALSYWEVLIKSMKGKLDVGDPRSWWAETIDQLQAVPLQLRPEHVSQIMNLPPIHQDPVDRAIIAQAMVEEFTLLSTDTDMHRYASARLRLIG